MKFIKPLACTTLTRCYEISGQFHLGLSLLLCHDLDGRRLYSEQDTWNFLGDHLPNGFAEEAIPRSWAEYLVLGHAHPPQRPATACRIRVRLGGLEKVIAVWGRRYWNGREVVGPEPFERMPIDWSLAAGGEGNDWNPVGSGLAPRGARLPLALPCFEYPEYPWTRPDAPIPPAGFGPLPRDWLPRKGRIGTYDNTWFEKEYPGIASNTDWRFFNLAPEDQQQPEPFLGNEPFALEHLHPERPLIEGTLPGLRGRAFITRHTEQLRLEEVPLRLMALWFFPEETRVLQVFQGAVETREEDAADLQHLLAAVEYLDQPRSMEHYAQVLEKRLDEDYGDLHSLREEDLVPSDLAVSLFEPRDIPPDIRSERMQAMARKEREAMRQQVAGHGLDPDEHAPAAEAEAPPPVERLDDLVQAIERFDKDSAARAQRMQATRKKALDSLVPLLEKEAVDTQRWREEMENPRSRGVPERPGRALRQQLETLRDETSGAAREDLEAILRDEARWRHLEDADRKVIDGYRATVHTMRPVPMRSEKDSTQAREALKRRIERGESLAGIDLTGCDLAGLDLRGADLRGAFLEHADLSTCDLSGARLDGAVLAHAALVGTTFREASLRGASLGATRMENTVFEGADLREAILDRARMRHVDLRHTRLDAISWLESTFEKVDFSGSTCEEELLFLKNDLRGSRFSGARWSEVVLMECRIDYADFQDAAFGKAAFVSVMGEAVRFQGLQLEAACFAQACRLPGADFRACRLHEVSFRGTDLADADFSRASITACDFSECDLRRSRFHEANATGCSFRRALLEDADFRSCNLMQANFSLARVDRGRFQQANLHASDWARADFGETGVDTRGALATRVRTHPRLRKDTRP